MLTCYLRVNICHFGRERENCGDKKYRREEEIGGAGVFGEENQSGGPEMWWERGIAYRNEQRQGKITIKDNTWKLRHLWLPVCWNFKGW